MISGCGPETSGKSVNPPPIDAQVHALREPHALLTAFSFLCSWLLFTESKWEHYWQGSWKDAVSRLSAPTVERGA